MFWGQIAGRGLSNMALLAVMRRAGRDDLTSHGFQSSFRHWAAEEANFHGEVVERLRRTPSPTRSRRPIGAATCLKGGAPDGVMAEARARPTSGQQCEALALRSLTIWLLLFGIARVVLS